MPRLLIAGCGFLGEALKSRFADDGWAVDTLSRSGGDDSRSCDLSDPDSVSALSGVYDLIIHCAATRGGGVEAYRSVYLKGCCHLLARFSDVPFIFTSSTSVYGQSDHGDVTEISLAEPVAETSSVLREVENLVIASGGVVARLSALCGPGRCHTLKSFLAGTARIDGAGERVLNFVHRDDAAAAFLLLAQQWEVVRGQIFNVSAAALNQLQCYQLLADHYSRTLPTVGDSAQTPRRRGSSSKRVDSKKIEALGWQPRYPDFLSIAQASE